METDPYMELIRRIMAGEEICLPDQVATDEVAGYIVSTIRLPAPIGENCYESALKKGEGNWRDRRALQDARGGAGGAPGAGRLHPAAGAGAARLPPKPGAQAGVSAPDPERVEREDQEEAPYVNEGGEYQPPALVRHEVT
jgi:hypothetical protein